ncbi:MAG: fumarate hydratase [Hyphomicrobiales bacterium]|nr:fumarate hydratase [Hyphomicrobiales bacterium]
MRNGASTTTPNVRTRPWDTGHPHPSRLQQNQSLSTKGYPCNNLSFRLVQNIGQVTLRLELFNKVNDLGVGAQGVGGRTTVLDVKIRTFPSHAASLPVALIPQCVADRHIKFILDGSGPAQFDPPDINNWPEVVLQNDANHVRRVDVDRLTPEEIRGWKAGDMLLISGHLLTARDKAHRRLVEMLDAGEPLPVDLRGRSIYYVGPVTAVGDEIVGPAGPTTSKRMDPFTERLLDDTGPLLTIGKAERGPDTIKAIARHKTAYLMAVGGAAYLVSKAIRSSRIVAFPELGMEAMHEFEVDDMPVTVAVDSKGQSIHTFGPARWRRTA